ncbi:Uncharacterised protein [Mycobacteroides abscessus]|nr:Uncharacterised protein [Mycobacteroides abscessus]CQA12333.1 Uncharacterised protein [Mycobacteroides abscessus]
MTHRGGYHPGAYRVDAGSPHTPLPGGEPNANVIGTLGHLVRNCGILDVLYIRQR